MGEHRGGYTPFSIDVSGALTDRQGVQEVVVEVWDPTDTGQQPTGKQALDPKGIWYTPTTGIWRTVWLEPIPESHISQLKLMPDVDRATLHVKVFTNDGATATRIKAVALRGDQEIASAEGAANLSLPLPITSPRLWSPDDPFLSTCA